MTVNHARLWLAGFAGGAAMNASMALTFGLIGFGPDANGFLIQSPAQSEKLIAVWTQLEPLPRIVNDPLPMVIGLLFFGVLHAYLFRWIAPAWPAGIWNRGWRFAALLFSLSFLFWEFFTPFNLFGEPIRLIAAELVFWGVIALADGLAIAAVLERRPA